MYLGVYEFRLKSELGSDGQMTNSKESLKWTKNVCYY